MLVAQNLADAAAFVNRFAPEHLSLPGGANGLLERIDSAGSIFLGDWSAQSFGDYASGTNHVLPTGGVARTRGGLSVSDFVKCISVQEVSRAGLRDSRRWSRNSRERKDLPRTRARSRCASEAADSACAARSERMRAYQSAARRPHRQTAPGFQRESHRLLARGSPGARETQRCFNFGLSGAGNACAAKAAKYFGVAPDELLLTNGTDEALSLVVNTFVEPRDSVLLVEPTYAMYRFYSELAGARIVAPRYDAAMCFPWNKCWRRCSAGPRVFFLPNPNSPTGNLLSARELQRILKAAHADDGRD